MRNWAMTQVLSPFGPIFSEMSLGPVSWRLGFIGLQCLEAINLVSLSTCRNGTCVNRRLYQQVLSARQVYCVNAITATSLRYSFLQAVTLSPFIPKRELSLFFVLICMKSNRELQAKYWYLICVLIDFNSIGLLVVSMYSVLK